ncbi:MAG TPA: [FeFe] hydrogenase H-cluster radical SAM maturase HydE [Spirochaetota bacterium]|nr:[FeFe] hydrogenase H-cluster radical SAM maturase HydE [Spirochaetota bacterium]HPJ33582.1 [FeFe] hydrogenase H-cluster radical SAM maturase HydE [Spirochaetota bacterium]
MTDSVSSPERGGLSKSEIIQFLCLRGEEQNVLHRKAAGIRRETLGNIVYINALIEFSNICSNDCYYCGLRKSNKKIKRYELTPEAILAAVDDAADAGINSIVLQSGERRDRKFTSYVSYTLKLIREKHPRMGITLAVGEQERPVYEEFYEYGASRYILRIETSDKKHYSKLHPDSMSYSNRLQCLHELRDIGFRVGTGVMVNSPHQTLENLADDIFFFTLFDMDICSLGPYIPHSDTPFGGIEYLPGETLNLGLNMIAVLRIAMPDLNIASSTSLDSLSPEGRELGLLAGGNVIIPQITSLTPGTDDLSSGHKPGGAIECRAFFNALENRIKSMEFTPCMGESAGTSRYMRKA